jgi:ribosomal protein S8E
MGLFTPLYKSKNPQKRIKWITKRARPKSRKHQRILANIINNDEGLYQDNKLSALNKITNQSILVEIIKNNKDSKIRCGAVQQINDQNILIEIAKSNIDFWARMEAVEKITDQNILIEIAKSDKDWLVRRTAVGKIESLEILTQIANSENNEYVRLEAVKKGNIGDVETIKWLINLMDSKKNGTQAPEVLKQLYLNGLISDEAKSIILNKKGMQLCEHSDHESCWVHDDSPSEYFDWQNNK